MRSTAPILGAAVVLGMVAASCLDGSENLRLASVSGQGEGGSSGGSSNMGGSSGSPRPAGNGGSSGGMPSNGGSSGGTMTTPGNGGAGGSAPSNPGGGGAGGSTMAKTDGGAPPQQTPDGGGMPSAGGAHTGRFKMLVMSKTLEFHHDSIPTGQQMLRDLGNTPDDMLPMGATKGSQFDVVIAKDDLSDFTDASLKAYEIIFWMSPTGTVFSSGGANGMVGMAAFQKYMENGGGWGGVHSATDFEKTGKWNWFHDNVDGAYFTTHENDGTPGTVITQPNGLNHPIMRGVQRTWSTSDEWYHMSRDVENLTGYTVLAKLNVDQRPVVWTHEMPTGGGRSCYTIRGHAQKVYAEPDFRRLVHQCILWATHRMQ